MAKEKIFQNKPKQVLKIQNEIRIFLNIKLLDFETFEPNRFWNSIQNLDHEDFKKKAFGNCFQIPVSNKFKSKSNFDKSECFLLAL
jgi:hypothetical protein